MHRITTLLLLVSSTGLFGQFTDDFSDGDFINNPVWNGDTANFQVDSAFRLQLNAPPVSGTSQLITASQAAWMASWEFWCRMDFNPSGSNYTRVYLMSTSADLSGPLDGYFVQIGGASGTVDDVSLFRQTGTSTLKIIDGIDGTVALTPQLGVHVERDFNGTFSLAIDTGLSGNFMNQGSTTDLQHLSSSYFGVQCIYTSTRSDQFFYDNFIVSGSVLSDTVPPIADSISLLNDSTIQVFFSEEVSSSTALDKTNYVIAGWGNPLNVNYNGLDSASTILSFSPPLVNGNYTISISNVEDQSGNTMQTTSFQFNIFKPVFGDIIINEIFPDPSPSVGLPPAEFVEILNTTSIPVDLEGYEYADASSTAVLSHFILGPNEYLILCAESDTNLFKVFGNVLGLSPWPSLNNTGDELVISSPNGILMDSTTYTDLWYGDDIKKNGGWSLERINPNYVCDVPQNWSASENNNGGTPGTTNSIFSTLSDTVRPELLSWKLQSNNVLQLSFSEAVDTTNALNNVLIPGINLLYYAASNPFDTEFDIFISPLDSSTLYPATLSNWADCSGNSIVDTSFSITIGSSPKPYDLIISEVFPDPDTEISPGLPVEYIEVYNRANYPIRLGGMQIGDPTSSGTILNGTLLPNEWAVLCDFRDINQFTGNVFGVDGWPSLNNDGDYIYIKSNVIIDELQYENTWHESGKNSGGWSLELINPNQFCTGSENWTSSLDSFGGTPAMPNSVLDSSRFTPFEVTTVSIEAQNSIRISFSQSIDFSDLERTLTILPENEIDSIITVDHRSFIVYCSPQFERGLQYSIQFRGIKNCNRTDSIGFNEEYFELPSTGDIIINEILFNPRGDGSDFIEFYNISEFPVTLYGWSLRSISPSGVVSIEQVDLALPIPSKGLIALAEDSQNVLLEYPGSASFTVRENDLPAFGNEAATVQILDPIGGIIDELSYSEDWHYELLNSVDGVSLERVRYDRPTQDPGNWFSASSEVDFGTPGYENSQRKTELEESSEVWLVDKYVSPNNDGFQDQLEIGYNFGAPGYTGSVHIYSAAGQPVVQIANNFLLSSSGIITWNGLNADGDPVETGMYIVLFTAFDLNGNEKLYKLVAVAIR